MFIGNIVSKGGRPGNSLFYYTKNLDDVMDDIPTIIIGWEYAKEIVGGKYRLSILEKKVDKNLYWTFSKNERRVDYEKDLSKFVALSIKEKEVVVTYKYINILTTKYGTVKNFLELLSSGKRLNIYVKNNSFIYVSNGNDVYGMDFNMTDYIGIERKKIYRRLYGQNNELFFSDKFLDKEIRENIKNSKMVPILYNSNDGKD